MTDVPSRAAAGFSSAFGAEPAGLWAAPGRVNLIGEHTDYNDGYVLPFALPHRVVVAAAARPEPRWRVWSEQSDETVEFEAAEADDPGRVEGWAGYVAGVVWALRSKGHEVPGADLAIASDVPAGAGLSSSAALESAVLTALADLGGLDVPVADRPALAQRAENDYVGMPCGIMDQSASIRAEAGHALFLDCRSLEIEQIPFDVADSGLAVLVVDTRAPHRHAGGEYASRRRACEEAAALLGVRRAARRRRPRRGAGRAARRRDAPPGPARGDREPACAGHGRRCCAPAGSREIGPLLTASHASMRDDFEITVPEVDLAVATALSAGAYGARMTGGGFGGCVLALVDAAETERVAAAVAAAYAERGFTAPAWFAARPGGGAERIE